MLGGGAISVALRHHSATNMQEPGGGRIEHHPYEKNPKIRRPQCTQMNAVEVLHPTVSA